eukprot:6482334-Amphidinium_carterae.1
MAMGGDDKQPLWEGFVQLLLASVLPQAKEGIHVQKAVLRLVRLNGVNDVADALEHIGGTCDVARQTCHPSDPAQEDMFQQLLLTCLGKAILPLLVFQERGQQAAEERPILCASPRDCHEGL